MGCGWTRANSHTRERFPTVSRYNASGTDHIANFQTSGEKPQIEFVEIDQRALEKGHLHVRVGFRSPTPLKPPVLGLIVSSKFGQPIFGSNTRMTGDEWHPEPMTSGVFVARRDDVPLCNDTYKISAWLGDGTQDYDTQLDAIIFEFTGGRYHPRATAPEVSGSVSLPWAWDLQAQ